MWHQRVPGGGVEGVVFAPDGRMFYTADAGGTFIVWDAKSKSFRKLFRLSHSRFRPPPGWNFTHFTANKGLLLVVRVTPLVIWDIKNDTEYARPSIMSESVPDLRAMPGNDAMLVFISDARRSIVTWDCAACKPGPVYDGWTKTAPLRSFDVAPNARTAALLDMFGLVVLFDLETRQELTRFSCPYGTERVRFSPDGTTLVVVGGKGVQLWDVPSRKARVEEVKLHSPSTTFAFHPKSPDFAALNPDRVLAFFNLQTGQPARVMEHILPRYAQCVTFSPDGTRCVVGGSNKQFIAFDVEPPAPPPPPARLSAFRP